ncbi:FHA domain-containing protein [Leptolyngbyaceae cyanobacterium CCMR0082]|uniref:FHA domain-containing protein n=2 Tax=Adonisia turfae TaxID=2950184 RepID=A0A6M0SFD4_9CYAN|nr:FHA domain-containing protein [Adonisia turfae]MDV3348027.1 FHA domain-containing protein [Leptothoe sp. LEGE 181152]NEZ60129.1 FHA domain-containing protein [Adonisia turfae CCMR0081]NEZ66733.1 FHA domain-containing protein [Adonisia turfae CCMR0082]
MSGEPVVIQFNWEDPVTGESQYASRQLPVAIGRETSKMPTQLENQPVSHLELIHQQVSRCHAVISMTNRQLYLSDKSANGTFLNGRPIQKNGQIFKPKDTIRIGPFKLTAMIINTTDANSTELNREYSHLAKSEMATAEPNAILGWLIGGGILLLMGIGLWLGGQALLNRARPTLDDPAESSLNLSNMEIGALEIPTKP